MEEEKKKIDEDRKKLNDTTHPKTVSLESTDDNDDETGKKEDAVSSIGSPVFALANMFN